MAKRFYEQCCRLCLYYGTDVGLVDVFSIPKLNSLVLDLYNIEVTPNDGSTTRVCSVCLKDTLDFNAQIKQYDRDRTHILEVNAKILQKVQTATPTTNAVSKATKDSASKENRAANESIQTTIKETASGNAKSSNEAPRAPQRQQQVTAESPSQTPSKTTVSRISSVENRATFASNDKASKGSNTKDKEKDKDKDKDKDNDKDKDKDKEKEKEKEKDKEKDKGKEKEKEKDKDGSRRSSQNQTDQSTAKPKSSSKGSEQRSSDKPGSVRSEHRPSESGHSSRGSKESTVPHAKYTDPRQRPSSPKSRRVNDSIGSGANRASTSGESSNKSKDSLKRSTEGREPTKSKNTDRTRSESTGTSASSKSSDKPQDKKQSSSYRDNSKTKDSNSGSKKSNADGGLRAFLMRENSSTKESAAPRNSASNHIQTNATIHGTDKPKATEHSTPPHRSNANVRTYGGANKNNRSMAPEKSDRREPASKPSTSTSGTRVRFAEGTIATPRDETPNLEANTVNRKRGPDGPPKLPRIKIRLLNRAEVEFISLNNATTANPTTTTVSVTTTNATMCTTATTTATTPMETTSLPSSQIVATSPIVQSRVSALQGSTPGIPKRRHSVYNTSLIRVSSNLFDSSKESDEFAAIRNNTMLRLAPLNNTVANNVTIRPVDTGFSQMASDASINHSSTLAPVVLNGAAGTSSSQQQNSVTYANILPRPVQKSVMQRRKSVCVANFRQISEQSAQSNTNYQTSFVPCTSIPANNVVGGLYTSSHNGMPVQSTVQNTVPITGTNYGPNTFISGNTTIRRVTLNASPSSAAAPLPSLRLSFGNNTIPVHILSRNAPLSTAGGVASNNVTGVSNTNAVGGSIPRPSIVGENNRNMPAFAPRTPQIILQPQPPQMPSFEHSYSINEPF